MVRITGEFEDIERRELQIHNLAKSIPIEIRELANHITGKSPISPDFYPQPLDRLNIIAKDIQEILVLSNGTFREAKKGEKISIGCRKQLRQVVVHLQNIQLRIDDPEMRRMFQGDLGLLEEELKLL